MTRLHINCSDFRAEIGNLLDGEVDPQFRVQLEAHLAECKACTVVYDSVRKTIRILADSHSFELSTAELKSGTESVMARIRALKGEA
jgi:predicted anti-sigma-YlaC factor YlaD